MTDDTEEKRYAPLDEALLTMAVAAAGLPPQDDTVEMYKVGVKIAPSNLSLSDDGGYASFGLEFTFQMVNPETHEPVGEPISVMGYVYLIGHYIAIGVPQ